MNILSYNIRGGGCLSKRKRVSFLLQFSKVEVCFIQETKLDGFNYNLAKYFWRGCEVEWSASNSEGAVGGMVILWKKKVI